MRGWGKHPAWQGAIIQTERLEIERVKKCALYVILGDEYEGYKNTIIKINLNYLDSSRKKLFLNFSSLTF